VADPPDTSIIAADISLANKYKKALVIDEWDWTGQHGGSDINSFISAIEKQSGTGDFIWSLCGRCTRVTKGLRSSAAGSFGHDAQCCNFVQHNDGYRCVGSMRSSTPI
jgi:hypothetical protein